VEIVVMKLKLYLCSDQEPLSDPANQDFDEVRELLEALDGLGILCEKVNTGETTDDELYK
jgi:hypothetical protein